MGKGQGHTMNQKQKQINKGANQKVRLAKRRHPLFFLAESIHSPNFFCQMLKTSKFAKLFHCQTFPLYGISSNQNNLLQLIPLYNSMDLNVVNRIRY